jgi:hypothetical protein
MQTVTLEIKIIGEACMQIAEINTPILFADFEMIDIRVGRFASVGEIQKYDNHMNLASDFGYHSRII